jgi:hypothetical protein
MGGQGKTFKEIAQLGGAKNIKQQERIIVRRFTISESLVMVNSVAFDCRVVLDDFRDSDVFGHC